MRFSGFIGPSYTLDSRALDVQRCVNWYPQKNEMGMGKSAETYNFITTPGLELLATIGSGPIRGQYRATNGFLYVVSGDTLYYVTSAWEGQAIGILATSTGNVSFADNGTICVLVDGDNGYYFTLGALSLTTIVSAGWRGSNIVQYMDGYFIFVDPNTQVFYISSLSGITLDPLDFASAEGSPDNILSFIVNHREIWFFGADSIESWYNTGNADFPLERINSGFIEGGIASAYSLAKINKTIFWIGQNKEGNGVVYAAQGFSPQRISTHAIELAIQSYGDISTAKAWTYQENGHEFYVLNFDSANTTWVYDLSEGLWHERAYWSSGAFARHRADNHSYSYNTHVVGDYQNGKIYKLNSSYFSDNGDEIRRMRITPHISNSNKRVKYKMLEVEASTGIGLTGSAQGSDPKVMLQFSNDGGFTWSSELWSDLGKEGNYKTRAIWRRLGMARDRVFKIMVSDPVKADLIGAEIEFEVLGS